MIRIVALIHALLWCISAFVGFLLAIPLLQLFSLPYLLGSVETLERAQLVAEYLLYGQTPSDFLANFLTLLGWASLLALMTAALMIVEATSFAFRPRRMRTVVLLVAGVWVLGLLLWTLYEASGRGLAWTSWAREGCPRLGVNSSQIILACEESQRGALDAYEALLSQGRRLLPLFVLLSCLSGLMLMTVSGKMTTFSQSQSVGGCIRCGLSSINCLLCRPRLKLALDDQQTRATIGQPLELTLTLGPASDIPVLDVRLSLHLPRGYRLLSDAPPSGWSMLQDQPPVLACDVVDQDRLLTLRVQTPSRQWRRYSSVSLSVRAETPFSYDHPSARCTIHSERAATWAERFGQRLRIGMLGLFKRFWAWLSRLARATWGWSRRRAPQISQAVQRAVIDTWRRYRDRPQP